MSTKATKSSHLRDGKPQQKTTGSPIDSRGLFLEPVTLSINFTREQNDGRSIDTIQDTEGMMCVFLTPIGDALRPKTTRRKTAFL